MTPRAEVFTLTNAEEALHRQIIQRVGRLHREQKLRICRDLTLLCSIATAGPLTFIALIWGATPALTVGLAAATIGALGLFAWVRRRDEAKYLFRRRTADHGLTTYPSRSSAAIVAACPAIDRLDGFRLRQARRRTFS
jgi:hypothetical protein